MNRSANETRLALYATPPHECSYLPNRRAVTLFADPGAPKDGELYARLSAHGFRRSGEYLYRPRCPNCHACVPVRIPVADFRARRRQRRTRERNRDLEVRFQEARFDDEHFQLYRRYLDARHRGGGMDTPTPQSYLDFITSSWSDTRFLEFRLNGRLLAVGVVDCMREALSAVYSFFDPDQPRRSLGRLTVLEEIEQARRLGLRWLYLGYWIAGCRKMDYKDEYQPLEYFIQGRWQPHPSRS